MSHVRSEVMSVIGKFLPDYSKEELKTKNFELDSLTMIQFIVELERAFEVEISDEYLIGDNFLNLAMTSEFMKLQIESARK